MQSVHGDAADAFPQEFDALIGRLNERVYRAASKERGDLDAGPTIFAFPQQMAALRDPLTQFVERHLSPRPSFNQQILLRGVYLTSGTQDGTQIDRLLGSIGRRFGVAADAVRQPPAARQGASSWSACSSRWSSASRGLQASTAASRCARWCGSLGRMRAILLFLIGSLVLLSVS